MIIEIESYIPKYVQLKQILIEEIRKQKPDTKILSEWELVKKYKVSRITVNKAVSDLVQEGFLYREQGKGTFIKGIELSQTKSIAVFVPYVSTGVYPKLVQAMEDVAHERGYSIILCNSNNDFEREERYSRRLLSKKIAGVTFVPIESDTEYERNSNCILYFIENRIPIVLLDRYTDMPHSELIDVDYVVTDNFKDSYKLTSHLIRLGHRRIGFLTVPFCHANHDRLLGYEKALKDNNIEPDEELVKRVKSEPDYDVDKTGVEEFLNMKDKPTAIYAVNDAHAYNVVRVLKALEIRIPEEMAVVGYDDMEFAVVMNPPLTTIRQPFHEQGQIAMNILIDRIEGKLTEKREVVLQSKLIVRESCGAKIMRQQ